MFVLSSCANHEAPHVDQVFIEVDEDFTRSAIGETTIPIYINRHGGTYLPGVGDNSATSTSAIVRLQGLSSATIPRFGGSDQVFFHTLGCVAEKFSRFNVVVTDQRPTEPHVELVLGGSPRALNLSEGVAGIAATISSGGLCGVNRRAVAFVFSAMFENNAEALCGFAAHEIGHTFTLDHSRLSRDLMYYTDVGSPQSFANAFASCGETEDRPCSCGRARQNSFEILRDMIGLTTVFGTHVNSASYRSAFLAPTSIASLFLEGVDGRDATLTLRARDGVHPITTVYRGANQINYLLPSIPFGPIEVDVATAVGTFTTKTVVAPVSPALFSYNATGRGAPAGQILRVFANGTRETLPAAQVDGTPTPIELRDAEHVFLILYGTGFRGRQGEASVTINGRPCEVTYASAQGDFFGLDQLNVRVPSSLAGLGDGELRLRVDGEESNTLSLRIR